MLDAVLGVCRMSRPLRPAREDPVVAALGCRIGPGRRANLRRVGRQEHGIGLHHPVRLVGQLHRARPVAGDEIAAERYPGTPGRRLVHRNGIAAAGMIDGVGGVGGSSVASNPTCLNLVELALRHVQRPGDAVGRAVRRDQHNGIGRDPPVRLICQLNAVIACRFEYVGTEQVPLPTGLLLVGDDIGSAAGVMDRVSRVRCPRLIGGPACIDGILPLRLKRRRPGRRRGRDRGIGGHWLELHGVGNDYPIGQIRQLDAVVAVRRQAERTQEIPSIFARALVDDDIGAAPVVMNRVSGIAGAGAAP